VERTAACDFKEILKADEGANVYDAIEPIEINDEYREARPSFSASSNI
jgi:hypothetical protein